MFTLRSVFESGEVYHEYLGNEYSFIGRNEAYDFFSDVFKDFFDKPHVADMDEKSDDTTRNCYGFVCNNNGLRIPVYSTNRYYVMSSNGQTFQRI